MNHARVVRWSRYLLFFILAVLPLERIPSIDLVAPVSVTIRLSQLAGLALIAINLPTMWQKRRQLLESPWRWAAAFWLICLVSAALSDHLSRALTVSAFTIFVGLLAWAVALRFEKRLVPRYFLIITISALTVCGFGLYQFFGDLLGLPTWATGLREAYTKVVFGFPRIQSTGLEPLYFGDYLLIPGGMLIVATALNYQRRLAGWSLLVVATVVWLTVSRGAMVALAMMLLAGLVLALVYSKIRSAGRLVSITLVSIGLAYGLLYLGTNVVVRSPTPGTAKALHNFSKQSTNITNGESSEGRAVTRVLAIQAFQSHPFLGIGPGNFGVFAQQAMPERFSVPTAIVNNEPLELLAETGAVGFVALAGFLITLVTSSLRNLQPKDSSSAVMTLGLVLALGGIAAQYLTFSTLYITHVWVAIGLLAGIWATSRAQPVKE